VLVLHDHFADVPGADFAERLALVSPATRVLLMTSSDSPAAAGWEAVAISDSASGQGFVDGIRAAAATAPPDVAGSSDAPQPDAEDPDVDLPHRDVRAPLGRAMVIVAFSGKGGTGTSMVASNLAVTLAEGVAGRSALIDLDLQFGDAASILHVENHPLSIADLASQGDDIESATLDDVLASGPAEVGVLRAPVSPELGEAISAGDLRTILRATARARRYVVVDTPSHIDEPVLEAFERADRILLVTSYNLSAVRGTKTTLLLLEALGVDPEDIDVVLNHTHPRSNYRREDIEEILGRRVLVDLPYDPQVDPSLDSGTPIVLAQPRAGLARRLIALAQHLAVPVVAELPVALEISAPMPPVYRRRFSLGRR
jgi:pilus assembly protein CpaE